MSYAAGDRNGSFQSTRTRLVQRSVSNLADVNATFANNGPMGNEVCIVITPDPACCCTILQSIPSGPYVLSQSFGRDQGEFLKAGGQWCWPAWKNVSHVVSRQVFTFNARPKSCPTRDSVFVDVNLSINMCVANDFERVQSFVYTLGAERLDAYLAMQVEESIRTLVYGVTHDRVNDLRSEFANEMLRTLSSKLANLGIDVRNVKITDVSLPQELQQRLEATTAFKTRIKEEEKNHEHRLQQLANDQEQKMAGIHQKYSIKQQQLRAEFDRYEVNLEERMAQAESARKVQMESTYGRREVDVTKAKGQLATAAYEGRAKKDETVSSASIYAQKSIHEATVSSKSKIIDAEATEKLAKNKAASVIVSAESEGKAAEQQELGKKFAQKKRMAELDKVLAGSGRFLVDSKHGGADLIKSFTSVRADLAVDSSTMSR